MRVAGISIEKVHSSVTTRSIKFEFVCQACGHTEPAFVQASVEGTSTNKFRIRDMLVDHDFEAQQASRQDSLDLARSRSAFVPCPKCHYVNERAIQAVSAGIRKSATAPAIFAAILIGPVIGGMIWLAVLAISVSFPDQQALFDSLIVPIFAVCILLVAWIARAVHIKKLMRAFDDDLFEMQQDVVFQTGDPERYYAILESGAFSQR